MSSSLFYRPDEKERFLAILRENKVQSIRVSFSGGGDSGDIDWVEFSTGVAEDSTENQQRLRDLNFEGWRTKASFNESLGRYVDEQELVTMSLRQFVERLTYDALERSGLDWYNNDGGQGALDLEVTDSGELSIELEVGINYVMTEPHSFNFGEGED